MPRATTFHIGSQGAHGPSASLTKAHGMNKDDGAVHYGEYLKYLAGLYANFLQRLKGTPEGTGTMLDTLTLYGSSNGNPTHSSTNLPIIISGGEVMGFKQGQYLRYGSDVPLTNLYATMLDGLGASQETFADSNGRLSDVLKA